MACFEFAKDFILETDASWVGLGTIVAHSHENRMVHPIAYANKTLQQHYADGTRGIRHHLGNKTLPLDIIVNFIQTINHS